MNKSLLVIGFLAATGLLIFIMSNQKETDTAPHAPHAPPPQDTTTTRECSSDAWTCSSQIKYSMCIDDLMDDSEPAVKQYIFDYLSDNNLIVSSNIPNTLEYGLSESNIILTPGNEVTNNCAKDQVFRFICQNPCRILE